MIPPRQSAEQVERALSFVRDTEWTDAAANEEDWYGVLAAEVLALRGVVDKLNAALEVLAEGDALSFKLRDILARVKALLPGWRHYAAELSEGYETEQARAIATEECAA